MDKTETTNRELMSALEDESSRLICIMLEELTYVPVHRENTIVLSYMKGDDIGKIYKHILSMLLQPLQRER